jgi:hypothetical protein
MAKAFQSTYWWAVALLALSILPALFLPRRAPETPLTDPLPTETALPLH